MVLRMMLAVITRPNISVLKSTIFSRDDVQLKKKNFVANIVWQIVRKFVKPISTFFNFRSSKENPKQKVFVVCRKPVQMKKNCSLINFAYLSNDDQLISGPMFLKRGKKVREGDFILKK